MVPIDRKPARPLTSREIAKIVSGLLGGLAGWCDPDDIAAAIEHFHENRELYLQTWRQSQKMIRDAQAAAESQNPDG